MFWHIAVNHPLDFLGRPLKGYGNTPYVMTQNMRGLFIIVSNGEIELETANVNEVCYFLNVHNAKP